jgi:hypothetical protein
MVSIPESSRFTRLPLIFDGKGSIPLNDIGIIAQQKKYASPIPKPPVK